jgi:hypothetical protein
MPASTHDASAMCLDLNLFLPEADSKDLVVPVCHHHTPVIGLAIQRIMPLSDTKQ